MPAPNTFLNFNYNSDNDTTVLWITRGSIFDLIGVFLGWFQLLTMLLSYIFFFVNAFNVKLQISKALFSNPEIQKSKVSLIFFFKMVIVYTLDKLGCSSCLGKLKAKHYLRQEYLCFLAFKELDEEMAVERMSCAIAAIKNQIDLDTIVTPGDYHFNYHFEEPKEYKEPPKSQTCREYKQCRANKSKTAEVAWWKKLIKDFDVTFRSVEYTLERSQRSSVLSILITYGWIAATILLICFLGVLSKTTTPTAVNVIYNSAVTLYTIDFNRTPLYLRQPNIAYNPNIVTVNASLVDANYNVLRSLQVLRRADCPPPPDFFLKEGAYIYCLTGTFDIPLAAGT